MVGAQDVDEMRGENGANDANDVNDVDVDVDDDDIMNVGNIAGATNIADITDVSDTTNTTNIEKRLVALSRASGPLRRSAMSVAARMVEGRGWERLGYARVGDYARERLGQSGRTLTEWARVERSLCDLPRLEAALVTGLLPWSKVRLLARFVSVEDEAFWIAKAAPMSVRALEHAVRAVDRSAAAVSGAVGPDAVRCDEAETDEEGLSTEQREWVRVRGSARMAFAWSHACRMASKVAGERIPQAVALELITAEVLSALPVVRESEREDQGSFVSRSASLGSTQLVGEMAGEFDGEMARAVAGAGAGAGAGEIVDDVSATKLGKLSEDDFAAPAIFGGDPAPRNGAHNGACDESRDGESTTALVQPELPSFVRSLLVGLADADPFELDARLRRVVRLEQRLDSEIAQLLRRVVDAHSRRGCRRRGDQTLASYARDRLGMSPRKARALVRLEKLSDHCAELRGAFREGRLSWVQAQVLAPLLASDVKTWPTAAAGQAGDQDVARRHDCRTQWLVFAQNVTVRRLEDVVKHALVTGEFNAEAANRDFGRVGNDGIAGADRHDDGSEGDDGSDGERRDRGDRANDGERRDRANDGDRGNKTEEGDEGDRGKTQSEDSERQICARPTESCMRVQVGIHVPPDVASLFQATLSAVRKLAERPLGRLPDEGESFEAMIEHALSTWEAQDPSIRRSRPNQRVFERDGWQCSVPGCSTQRNLQAHHIVFRSAGGGDGLENQTTLCAFHHHRGIHARRVGVRGRAPQRLRFELGLRPGEAPLVSYVSGDRVAAHTH